MGESILKLQQIRKSFDHTEVLKGVDLEVAQGEFITLLGASGCGKTTTLRIIAGLELPDSGSVILEGRDITDWEPNKRDVNTVFQNYALFPHMNVADNVGYGLKIRKVPKAEIAERVKQALRLVQPGVLWRFFQTPLAERMRRADEEGRLYKEQQFVVGIPAREMDEADSDELVLIQGIIDAWFEDEDGAVLVDYKTDRIGEGEEAVLLDRYRLQLIYYRRALEQITGKTVRQAFLYSLALQKEIPVF